MEASNKLAMALIQQEETKKQFKDQVKEKDEEIEKMKETMNKLQTEHDAKHKEMQHFKNLYEDSYE